MLEVMTSSIDTLPKKFGTRVRAERSRQGMSQEQLALKCGLDRTYISGIERGRRNPSLKNIAKIAHSLKLSLPEIVTF